MVDAVLRDVYFWPCELGPQLRVASGKIYGDTKGRFPDGLRVRTSYLVEGPDENGVIKTRNSTYRIESYEKVRPDAAIQNLREHQTQLDADGIQVGVSRQALEELLAWVA